jgi:hypothetical protein
MNDLTAVHVKKSMTPRHELILEEKIELEYRLTGLYIISKAKGHNNRRFFFKKKILYCN